VTSRPELQRFVVSADDAALDKIHPRLWLEAHDPKRQSLRKLIAALPYTLRNTVLRYLRSIGR
jgi:hypothetical protein